MHDLCAFETCLRRVPEKHQEGQGLDYDGGEQGL
jgi:hypothetical protein